MADIVSSILADCGIGADAQKPVPDGPFNSFAERHRQALISNLEQAKASIEILIGLATNHGHADQAFAAQAERLAGVLHCASIDTAYFNFTRECRGTC